MHRRAKTDKSLELYDIVALISAHRNSLTPSLKRVSDNLKIHAHNREETHMTSLVTCSIASQRVGKHESTIRRLASKGMFYSEKSKDGTWLVSIEHVIAYFADKATSSAINIEQQVSSSDNTVAHERSMLLEKVEMLERMLAHQREINERLHENQEFNKTLISQLIKRLPIALPESKSADVIKGAAIAQPQDVDVQPSKTQPPRSNTVSDEWLSIDDAADALGISRSGLQKRIRKGLYKTRNGKNIYGVKRVEVQI